MSYTIDEVSRVLAGPTPRRKMLRLIAGTLAGGLFGSVALGQSGSCPAGTAVGASCGNKGEKKCCGQFCLGFGNSEFCCSNSGRCPPTQCCEARCCCPPGFNFRPNGSGACTDSGNGFCLTGPGTKCVAGG
jgi:hypothetical protein